MEIRGLVYRGVENIYTQEFSPIIFSDWHFKDEEVEKSLEIGSVELMMIDHDDEMKWQRKIRAFRCGQIYGTYIITSIGTISYLFRNQDKNSIC